MSIITVLLTKMIIYLPLKGVLLDLFKNILVSFLINYNVMLYNEQ